MTVFAGSAIASQAHRRLDAYCGERTQDRAPDQYSPMLEPRAKLRGMM